MKNTRRGIQKRKRSRSNAQPGSKRRRGRPKQSEHAPLACIVPDCGRPRYARGLCQTHYGQLRTTGTLKAIRPYRKRSEGTVKLSGLRVTPECAEEVNRLAESKGLSLGGAIAEILEEWLSHHAQAPK